LWPHDCVARREIGRNAATTNALYT
jgi:hypothetical protein